MAFPQTAEIPLCADEELSSSEKIIKMPDQREDFRDIIARVDERTRRQELDLQRIRDSQKDLKQEIQKTYVTKTEFETIKKIFHSVLIALVLLILNAVAGKVLGFK